MKNWIVVYGTLVNTAAGAGGFEFIGPFTMEDAISFKDRYTQSEYAKSGYICIALELLSPGEE